MQCYSDMSVKDENSLIGYESEQWKEEKFDIKYHDIKTEVKEECNYGNLIYIILSMFVAKEHFKIDFITAYFWRLQFTS